MSAAEPTRARPGIGNAEWQERKVAAIARGQGNIAPVYVERAKNAELWDVEGKRYIDFGTGIAVCNTGGLRYLNVETGNLGKDHSNF